MSIKMSDVSSSRISSLVKVTVSKFQLPSEARMVYISSNTEAEILLPTVFDAYSELVIKRHPKMKHDVFIRSEQETVDMEYGISLNAESSSVRLRCYDSQWYTV